MPTTPTTEPTTTIDLGPTIPLWLRRGRCPNCARPIVYNGNYWCSGRKDKTIDCNWVLGSDREALAELGRDLAGRLLSDLLADNYIKRDLR